MEDQELFKSFTFKLYNFNPSRHTDNSQGVGKHYIGYMYRGTAQIISTKGRIDICEGDLFYIPKGCKYHSYWYGKDGALFDSFAFSAIPQLDHISYCLQKITITDQIRELHTLLASDRTVNARSVGLLYQLLWAMLPTMKQATVSRGNSLAHHLADAIAQSPDSSLEQIARSCNVSQSTMYHVLRRELGKTPNRLRQEAKCQQAVKLLTSTDMSVEQICAQLGFSSSSYMRKLLHATTGKTPLQIRKASQSM